MGVQRPEGDAKEFVEPKTDYQLSLEKLVLIEFQQKFE